MPFDFISIESLLMFMQFGSKSIDLSCHQVMGILNVTPDSFFDGGQYFRRGGNGSDISPALKQVESMVLAGASFIDVGGESTRPGAKPVSLQEEMDRVLPVVEAVSSSADVVISVDTSTPEIMLEAAKLGAGLINDVRALQKPGAIEAAKKTGLPVCLMHMQGQPKSMQTLPKYDDVIEEVQHFFEQRISACCAAGIAEEQIILDPGFGFGKNDRHNIALLKNMRKLQTSLSGESEVMPLLAGISRKSMIGRLLGRSENERLAGSLALAQYALEYGASILRVHDVPETVDIVNMFKIIHSE